MINKDRLYEVDQIVSENPNAKDIIPAEYMEEFQRLMDFFDSLPKETSQDAPF